MKHFFIHVLAVIMLPMITVSEGVSEDGLHEYRQKTSVDSTDASADKAVKDSLKLNCSSTLDDYLQYAAAHNPELESAFYRCKASLEKIPQARALPDPQLGYSFEDMGGGLGSFRHWVEVSQMFPWFGKRDLMGEQAQIETDIEEQMYRDMKLQLDTMVTEAYAEYYYLSREIEVTEENMKLIIYLESVAQTRYAAGNGSQSDIVKAQVELGMLEVQILSLHDLLRPVTARFNSVLNRPDDAPLQVLSKLPDVGVMVSDEELDHRLREDNPALRVAALQVRREEKATALARTNYYPDFMLGVGAETGGKNSPGFMGNSGNSYMGMFSLNVPLWRGKNRAAVKEAEGMHRSAEKTRNNRENELVTELQAFYYRYRDSGRKVKLFRDSLMPKARQALAVSQRAYEAGSADFLDIIDAQRTLLELELSLERALTDRVINYASILRLIGMDRPSVD